VAADLGVEGAWRHSGLAAACRVAAAAAAAARAAPLPPPPLPDHCAPSFPAHEELAALAEPPPAEVAGWVVAVRRGSDGLAGVLESAAVLSHAAYADELAAVAQRELARLRAAGVHPPTLVAALSERLLRQLLAGIVDALEQAVDAAISDVFFKNE